MNRPFIIFLFASLFILLMSVPQIGAQELPPPDSETEENQPNQLATASAEGEAPRALPVEGATQTPVIDPDEFVKNPELPFTGTLEEAYEEKEEDEEELFGEEEDEGEEEIKEDEEGKTHEIRFEFASLVQFLHPEDPSPSLEIQYTTEFEAPVTIEKKKESQKLTATIETQTWGSIAHNEFFDCRLEIVLPESSVNLTTRLRQEPPSEEGEEAPPPSLVMKIEFGENMMEDWFSYCTDVGGAILNTQGAPENYNMQVLKMIEPALSALVLEEFDLAEETTIELSVPSTTIDDTEINYTIFLSGEGNLTISPLEP